MKVFLEKVHPHSRALAPLVVALGLLVITSMVLSLIQSQALAEPVSEPAIEKMVDTGQAGPGDTLTYTVHAWREGTGQPIYNAMITDTVADELAITWMTATYGAYGYTSDVLTWTGDLGDVWITFTAEISSGIPTATITNTAELAGDGELIASNTVATEVSPGYLEIIKMVSPAEARPGQSLAYTVYITNTGNGTVDSAVMTDELPEEVDYAGGLGASHGTWGVANEVITWTGSVDPSEVVTITFTANISATLGEETSYITNTVEVTGAGLPVSDSVRATVATTQTFHFPFIAMSYPPVPELYAIPTPGDNNTYTVSWEGTNSPVLEHYVLQESTNPGFSTYTEWETGDTSKAFEKGAVFSTYYYRVRADGTTWGDGPWSNIRSVALGFYDEFNNASSGWPNDRGVMYVDSGGIPHYWWRKYLPTTGSGQYRILIDQGGPYAWFYQPFAKAPYVPSSNKFCIESNMKFEEGNMWANMGVVIGAHATDTQIYAFCMSRNNDPGLGWFLMRKDDYEFPTDKAKYRRGCSGPTYKIEGFAPGGQDVRAGTSRESWNRVRLGIDGDKVKVYIDDYYKGEKTLAGLSDTTYIGVIGGDYELTPIDIRFDYFKVVIGSDCNY